MDLTVNTITEDIQRQAIKILYDGLNTEISTRASGWIAKDNTFFASIGRPSPGFTVESIESENFYPGNVPSLINAELEKYPNCAAYAWRATPRGSSDDMGEEYSIILEVELMVKSHLSELEVNSRIQKTLEATHAVLMRNRSLNHKVTPIGAPTVSMGDVFVRRAEHSRGDRWFWQGGALSYAINKYINMV